MEGCTPNTITTEIAERFKRECDEPFKRLVMAKVDAWRSRLLRNSLSTKSSESKFFRQTIWIPMEVKPEVPACFRVPGCSVALSVSVIPKPLRYGPSLFDFIGSSNGVEIFYPADPGQLKYLKARKYSKNTVYYLYTNGRLGVYDHPNLPMMRVDGVFDSPMAAMEFNCNSNGDCDYWNSEYPVTGDVKQMIVEGILEKDFPVPQIVSDNKEVEVWPG